MGGVLVCLTQILMFCLGTITAWREAIMPVAPFLLVVVTSFTYLGVIFVTSVCFPTPVMHLPGNRALATACVKSFVGLGGAAVSQVFRLLFGTPTEDLGALRCLLLWAFVSLGCTVLAAGSLPPDRRTDAAPVEPRRALRALWVAIAVLGVFATVTPLTEGAAHDALVVIMLGLAMLPLPVCLRYGRSTVAVMNVQTAAVPMMHASLLGGPDVARSDARPLTTGASEGASASLAATAEASSSPGQTGSGLGGAVAEADVVVRSIVGDVDVPSMASSLKSLETRGGASAPVDSTILAPPAAGPAPTESTRQFSLLEMLGTPDAWLLWYAGSVIIGGGGLLATQLAFMLQSMSAPDTLVTTCVTTFSTGNLLGRLTAPVASSFLLTDRGLARPWMLLLILLLMAISQFAFRVCAEPSAITPGGGAQQTLLTAAAAAGGLSFGAVWPMLVILASELFGSRHLSINYLFYDGGCGAVGTVLLANLLPSFVYHHADPSPLMNPAPAATADPQPVSAAPAPPPPVKPCIGSKCFGPTHEVIMALCAVGAVAVVLLSWRSASLYRRVAAGR